MKIKDLKKSAFTLIELIVSLALVCIVILGVFAISNVLSNNNQDYGQRYLVRSETQATLNHILNNAALAAGSLMGNDEGILYNGNQPAVFTDLNSFCIHQPGNYNAVTQVTTLNSNITNSTNDIWLCYEYYPPGDPNFPNQIRWCTETYNIGTADPRGAKTCAASGNTTTFLGSADGITPAFTNASAGQLTFSITINNCLNDTTAAGTCNGNGQSPGSTPGVSSDPVNNPEVSLSGSIIPTQESN